MSTPLPRQHSAPPIHQEVTLPTRGAAEAGAEAAEAGAEAAEAAEAAEMAYALYIPTEALPPATTAFGPAVAQRP
nr:hypothetical protein Ade03nite_12250 [Actinoplanes derwentensis]